MDFTKLKLFCKKNRNENITKRKTGANGPI